MTSSPSKNGCILLAAFLLALALAAGGVGFTLHEADPATHLARLQQVEEARQAAERTDLFWRSVQPAQVLAFDAMILSLPVIGVVGLVGLGLVVWQVAHQRRHLVYPKNGHLPVSVDQVVNGSTLALAAAGIAGHHETARTAAANPPLMPSHVSGNFHYSPRQLVGRSSGAAPALAGPQETAPALLPAPAFSTILRQGFTRQNAVLVGLDAQHDPVYTDLAGLLSVAILGVPGSGKSRSAALLVAQATAYCGVKVAIADPHQGNAESVTTLLDPLSRAYWRPPVATTSDARRLVGELIDELDRRIQGAPCYPVALVIDEFSGYMRADGGVMAGDIERLVLEGRKFALTCLLLGQSWVVGRSGGSSLRDSLQSAVMHRAKPQTARAIWPDIGRATATLAPGQALFARATDTEPRLLSVPLFTREDATQLARLLPPPREAYPTGGGRSDTRSWEQSPLRPEGLSCTNQDRPAAAAPEVGQTPTTPPPVPPVPPVDAPDEQPQNVLEFTPRTGGTGGTATTDRAAYIRQLHAQGLSRNAISALVFGHKSSTTLAEIRAALESENVS